MKLKRAATTYVATLGILTTVAALLWAANGGPPDGAWILAAPIMAVNILVAAVFGLVAYFGD